MNARWTPRVGDLVTTDDGYGRVTRITGRNALVALDAVGGLVVEMALAALRPATELPAEVINGPKPEIATVPVVAGNEVDRRAIEALRFGLAPLSRIADLTLEYAELRRWTERRLPGGRAVVSAVTGPFGTGKSHSMAVIRHVAMGEGYLTARVEVDGQKVSLSDPAALLHQLWRTLEGREFVVSSPLLELYLMAIQKGARMPAVAPRGTDRIKHNYEVVSRIQRAGKINFLADPLQGLLDSSGELTTAEVWSQIKRYGVDCGAYQVKPMIGRFVEDRPYDFVEVLVGHAIIAQLAGFRGLIVTIDEFEVESALLSTLKQERINALLSVIRSYLEDNLDHPASPLGLFFATVGDEEHSGDQYILDCIGDDIDGQFELRPWGQHELEELAASVHHVYCDAYGIGAQFDSNRAARVAADEWRRGGADSGVIRSFVKRWVAELDRAHGPTPR